MTNAESIRENILKTISDSQKKLTPHELEKELFRRLGLERKQVKSVIRSLLTEGEISYTYQFGCTFLEPSFNKPVRISEYVVLKPPEIPYDPGPEDAVIQIRGGAAFGTGRHPSTRVAIRGIEYAMRISGAEITTGERRKTDGRLLDIGTGSGILAITAVKMGLRGGIGIDTDPCAVAEARENVRLNGLEDRIHICDRPVKHIRERFSMIIANLRYPTLERLAALIAEMTDKDGVVILSGIQTDEVADVITTYSNNGFELRHRETEKGWVGIVMQGPGFPLMLSPDC